MKLIKTVSDYKKALAQFEKIFNAPKGTPQSDAADVLAVLIERYENEHYWVNAPDPIEAIKYRMQQQNLKQSDIAVYFGGKDKASKVLNRKRKLTIEMIRNLNQFLHIPLDALVKKY
jgi:HTH-type transcriptional regulator/antitoxin HigA